MRKVVRFIDDMLLSLIQIRHINKLIQRNLFLRNIGKRNDCNQPKVLICYLTEPLFESEDKSVEHPKNFQMMQLLTYFIDKSYCVDICNYVNGDIFRDATLSYDVIIGQGPSYDIAINQLHHRCSILFLTENNPELVNLNYNERIKYFQERHPFLNYKKSIKRTGVFNISSIQDSNAILAINSRYSAESLKRYCDNVYPITVNSIGNSHMIENNSAIVRNKRNFVWLGSVGFIHKGLDILLDVFRALPEYTLNVYGVPKSEMGLWNKLKSKNTHLHPYIDVTSERFIEEVVKQNTFVISLSCSEGIQTGIATCMRCGLIPIVTKDCGYDEHESIIILKDYHVEYIIKELRKIAALDDYILREKSYLAQSFSNYKYTNEQFLIELHSALNNILIQYE